MKKFALYIMLLILNNIKNSKVGKYTKFITADNWKNGLLIDRS